MLEKISLPWKETNYVSHPQRQNYVHNKEKEVLEVIHKKAELASLGNNVKTFPINTQRNFKGPLTRKKKISKSKKSSI